MNNEQILVVMFGSVIIFNIIEMFFLGWNFHNYMIILLCIIIIMNQQSIQLERNLGRVEGRLDMLRRITNFVKKGEKINKCDKNV